MGEDMTVSIGLVVFCNGARGRCTNRFETSIIMPADYLEAAQANASDMAVEHGWAERLGLHYCPDCRGEVDDVGLGILDDVPAELDTYEIDVRTGVPESQFGDALAVQVTGRTLEQLWDEIRAEHARHQARLCHHPRGEWTAGVIQGGIACHFFACPDCPASAFDMHAPHLVAPWVLDG
jgi:hypothetical protein